MATNTKDDRPGPPADLESPPDRSVEPLSHDQRRALFDLPEAPARGAAAPARRPDDEPLELANERAAAEAEKAVSRVRVGSGVVVGGAVAFLRLGVVAIVAGALLFGGLSYVYRH